MCKTYLYILKLLHFECAGYRSMVQKFEVETIKIRTNMKTARTQNFFFCKFSKSRFERQIKGRMSKIMKTVEVAFHKLFTKLSHKTVI
jgi:hypothetical protein